MIFDVTTLSRPRRLAKAMSMAFSRRKLPVPLSTCQELIARMYGHDDWHRMTKSLACVPAMSDEVAGPLVASSRRDHQLSVLVDSGIPADVAGVVLDEVRPTGRGRTQEAIFPRLLLRAVEHRPDGSNVELPPVDATSHVTGMLIQMGIDRFMRSLVGNPRAFLPPGAIYDVSYRIVQGHKLEFPDVRTAVESFLPLVGNAEDPRVAKAFLKALRRIDLRPEALTSAQDLLDIVSKGTFEPDISRFDMVCGVGPYASPHNEGYMNATDVDGAYEAWCHAKFRDLDPQPLQDGPLRDAWSARFLAWVREHEPPFVFGVLPSHWGGIDPAEVRRVVAEDDDGGHWWIDQLLESGLDDHHEDAHESVVDEGALFAFLKEWKPHAAMGDEIDLSLEPFLEGWNARQTIVTHWADRKLIVPTRPDVTLVDVIAWCRQEVRRRETDMLSRPTWTAPAFADAEDASAS